MGSKKQTPVVCSGISKRLQKLKGSVSKETARKFLFGPPASSLTPFQKRLYFLLTTQVPKGTYTTYGAIAKALHSSPRAVGQALKRNPFAVPRTDDEPFPEVLVPCHRVVRTDRSMGGFSGHTSGWEIERKVEILHLEGVEPEHTGPNEIILNADNLKEDLEEISET